MSIVAGRLAAKPEIRIFESGSVLMRLLITVRTEEPRRRVDVIPVVMWNIDLDKYSGLERGDRVWTAGSLQRRFWSDIDSRRSRIEMVAETVQLTAGIEGEKEEGL